MKTKEELNELKEEVETVSRKLNDLNEEELAQVSGGYDPGNPPPPSNRPVDENGKYHCWNCDGICVLIDVPNLPKYQYCPYCKSEFGWR